MRARRPSVVAPRTARVKALIPQLTAAKANQVIKGDSPCTYVFQLDSRKIPLDVRKAVAKTPLVPTMVLANGE